MKRADMPFCVVCWRRSASCAPRELAECGFTVAGAAPMLCRNCAASARLRMARGALRFKSAASIVERVEQGLLFVMLAGVTSCTPHHRAVVRDTADLLNAAADLAETVCVAIDDPDECARRCLEEAKRGGAR